MKSVDTALRVATWDSDDPLSHPFSGTRSAEICAFCGMARSSHLPDDAFSRAGTLRVRGDGGRAYNVDAGELRSAVASHRPQVRVRTKTGRPLFVYVDKDQQPHYTSLPWPGSEPAFVPTASLSEVTR